MLRCTINGGSAGWMSTPVSVRKGWKKKTGRGLHFVFNVSPEQSAAVVPAFFRMSDKKRGEMEREASWRKGRGWVVVEGGRKREMEGLLTCTCLQSLRIHCTIHLLCLYCHG